MFGEKGNVGGLNFFRLLIEARFLMGGGTLAFDDLRWLLLFGVIYFIGGCGTSSGVISGSPSLFTFSSTNVNISKVFYSSCC